MLTRSLTLCLVFIATLTQANSTTIRVAGTPGILVETVAEKVLAKVYKDIGIDLVVERLPAARATIELQAKHFDGELVRIYSYQEAIPDLVRIPVPLAVIETQPFTLAAMHIDTQKLPDYHYAIVRGIKHTQDATKNFNKVILLTEPSRMFEILLLGRADIAITTKSNGEYLLRQMGLEKQIIANGEPWARHELCHYLNVQHTEVINKLTEKLTEMHSNGTLQQLWQQESERLNP